jgi:hypothetical protein
MAFRVVRTRQGRRGDGVGGGYDDGGSQVGCQGSSFRAVRYSAPLDNPATATTTTTTTSQSRLNLENNKKHNKSATEQRIGTRLDFGTFD